MRLGVFVGAEFIIGFDSLHGVRVVCPMLLCEHCWYLFLVSMCIDTL